MALRVDFLWWFSNYLLTVMVVGLFFISQWFGNGML